MLSTASAQRFCSFLLNISEYEREIEFIRQTLCEQIEFEPYAAFMRLDRKKQGYVTATEINKFLESNNIFYTQADCEYFIQQYDKDGDSNLVFAEFLYSVLPLDNPELRTLACQRPNYNVEVDEYLTYDLEYTLSKLLETEIELGKSIISQAKEQNLNQSYTLRKAFNTVDTEQNGYIDFNSLKQFFKQCSILPFDEEIICVLRRLDFDDNGQITFKEFSDRLNPNNIEQQQQCESEQLSTIKQEKQREISSDPNYISPELKIKLERFSTKKSTQRDAIQQQVSPKTISPTAETLTEYQSPIKRDKSYFSGVSTGINLSSNKKSTQKQYYSPIQQPMQFTSGQKSAQFSQMKSPITYKSYLKYTPNKAVTFVDNDYEQYQQDNIVVWSLRQFVNVDRELELNKQDLALRPDFNLLDGFRVLDRSSKGNVSAGEVELRLNELKIYPSKEELYLFIRKYDSDNDGKLRYSDFVDAFTPLQNEYSTLLNSRFPKNLEKFQDPLEVFSLETRRLFVRILRQLINNQVNSEKIRQRLNQNPEFNIHETFKSIDNDRDGYIKQQEDNYIFLTEKELGYLMNRFNIKGDGRITYSEFVQELTPRTTRYI